MGPMMGWFVNASDSPGRPLPSTLSVLLPSASPVTSPSTVFGARPWRNALETSRPLRLTIRERLEVPRGKEISTRTSLPLMRSGSFETVLITNLSWRSRSSWPATEKLEPNAIATKNNLPRNRVIAILLVVVWIRGWSGGPSRPSQPEPTASAPRTKTRRHLACQDAPRGLRRVATGAWFRLVQRGGARWESERRWFSGFV